MDNWKELSLTKKVILGSAIILAASFAPELMILVDVGGIELALTFLLFYFKPAIEWCKCKKQEIDEDLQIAKVIILNSALASPRILTLNTIYCSFFMLITGSLLFSFSFFIPVLFVSGVYI